MQTLTTAKLNTSSLAWVTILLKREICATFRARNSTECVREIRRENLREQIAALRELKAAKYL